MERTLWYSEKAIKQIGDYLSLIPNDFVGIAAGEEVRRELGHLLKNPGLGTAPTGPFETRPVFRFRLHLGDQPRLAQVSFRVNDALNRVEILTFLSTPV